MGKNEIQVDLEKENVSLKRTLKYISHELLNVLTLVDHSVKEVDGSVNQVKDSRYWNYIINDLDYMVKILRELSNYNHCDELHTETTSVSRWVRYTVGEMAEKYRNRAKIVFQVEGEDNLYISEIDISKIRQVIVNLIKNAVEALDENRDGFVAVYMTRENKWINIDILDNGCGISEEDQQRIFEEGISVNKKDGSGLGLAITRKIIKSHGGDISVQSIPGENTIFNIKLPV